jgi:hypothetical protein
MARGLFFAAAKGCLYFVCISGALFGRVFKGQKISGLLFKISGSDFKIRATNFFLAPTRVKSAENQFSFFECPVMLFPNLIFLFFMSAFVLRRGGCGNAPDGVQFAMWALQKRRFR